MSIPQPIANPQTVGNIGLFYVCYRLSRMGWNVMPTTRNAKGIDIVIYNQDATRTRTIQVKTLSRGSPVPLSNNLRHLIADFVVVCRHVIRELPECFVLTPQEVRALAHRGEKNDRVSFWLQPRDYATDEFREKWERIGSGLLPKIRILPMDAELEFNSRSIKDVQEKFFLKELLSPERPPGKYWYRVTGLNADFGTIVLFQYNGMLIASATLIKIEHFEIPEKGVYHGAFYFDAQTIKVFDPIEPEVVTEIWPEFKGFSHVKWTLDPEGMALFERRLTSVKSPK